MFVVMSDSHTDRRVIESIKEYYQDKATAIFHCGDSELPSSDPIWEGITVVAGKCDDDEGYHDFLIKEVEQQRILISHGHLFYVGLGLERYSYFAEEKNVDIALFGHIHQPVAQRINQILYLNPGSVAQPRGAHQTKMYALVEKKGKKIEVSYRNLNHEPIPDLQFLL